MVCFPLAWVDLLPREWVEPAGRVSVIVLAFVGVLLAAHLFPVLRQRALMRKDLAAKGCVATEIWWLPFRRGLLVALEGYYLWHRRGTVWGRVYRVRYVNRDGRLLVAVCMFGADHAPFWTDEYPEPGYDAFGNPPNLPNFGRARAAEPAMPAMPAADGRSVGAAVADQPDFPSRGDLSGVWGNGTAAEGPPDFARLRPTFSTPEPKVSSGETWWSAAFWTMVATAVSAVVVWADGTRAKFLERLSDEGRVTTGQITKVVGWRRRASTTYTAWYAYQAGGRRYESSKQVDRDEAASLDPGDAVTVTYLPSEPQRNIARSLDDERNRVATSARVGKTVCGTLWGIVVVSTTLKMVRRRSRSSDW
jgi:hypothetical protein